MGGSTVYNSQSGQFVNFRKPEGDSVFWFVHAIDGGLR